MKQTIINISKKIIPNDIRVYLRKLNWRYHYLIQTMSFNPSQKKVYCPIAEKEFKTFVKIGNNLITPTNGARARHRLVWHYLQDKVKIKSKKLRLLHTAPEMSFFEVLTKLKNIDYVPGDKMVDGYSNQKDIQNIDLTNIEFDDFDCIISNHVLEHIPDDMKAMSEMFRVLKVGGIAVITVPIEHTLSETYENSSINTPKDRKKHFGQWDHVRLYGLDIKDRLEKVGFSVEMVKYAEQFSKEENEKFGFVNDYIIIAKKLSNNK